MKKGLAVFAIVALFLFPLYLRAIVQSSDFLEQAQRAVDQRNYQAALTLYRKAIGWRSPLNAYSERAINALRQMSTDQNLAPEQRQAAKAALYSGLMSSRSFLDLLSKDEISALKQELLLESQAEAQVDLVRPGHNEGVNLYVQLLAQLAFWAWLLSVVFTIFRGFDADGFTRKGPLVGGGALAIGAFSLWLYLLQWV